MEPTTENRPRYEQVKRRIYEILEVAEEGDWPSRIVDVFICAVIIINIVAIILESVPSLREAYRVQFWWIETVTVLLFTVEYALRLWSCTVSPIFSNPITGRIRFAFTFYMLVDFLAILPYYMAVIGFDLRIMRALRLFRIIRLLKIARYSSALQTFGRVLLKSRGELGMAVFSMIILLILSSSLMFFAEREVQPELFSSIPAAMWWGIATLTTVGYGDIYPLTPFGKVLGSIIAVLGVAMFALPAGILGAAFSGELHGDDNREETICPHCGKTITTS